MKLNYYKTILITWLVVMPFMSGAIPVLGASDSFNPPMLASDTASSSFQVYATMTAGEILIAILMFTLIMLTLFNIFMRRV